MKPVGVGLKLDDFGTGYSSLSYLRDLPFDTLKIDQSCVRELAGNGTNQELVKTILSMANDLRMDVVAEGVETEEEAEMLRSMGCEYGQGYLYSRPVPVEIAERLLETNQP
jgi:EAL domain-containing protein (putative c-di-GMP-specific phosphodiesterase class I)